MSVKIHFIGIGGIGLSALAEFYLIKGYQVSGSDLTASEITNHLKRLGAKIYIGHKKENVPQGAALIIYSAAIGQNNPELKISVKMAIKTQSYAENLGQLTKKYFTIAVSGTHGKSTTTAMLALILEKAGLDPTVIIGTKLKEWGNTNFRMGQGKYLLIEADEYKASFLNYWPKIIVLTNIEKEHLDYYKNLKNILRTFKKYIGHLPKNGYLILNQDDFHAKNLRGSKRAVFYFLNQPLADKIKEILPVPGKHNISNALAALTTAQVLKIPDKVSFRTLAQFKGTWRRFEYKGKYKGALIFDDYAHHPTEIKATLEAGKEYMKDKKLKGRLWAVFQPHQRERLMALFDDFVNAFDLADKKVILDVFEVAGRENIKKTKLTSRVLARKISGKYIATLEQAGRYLRKNLKKGDLILLMGAGDIYKLKI